MNLREPFEVWKMTHPADFVPALVRQPRAVRIGERVFQSDTAGEEEHKLVVIEVAFSAVRMANTFSMSISYYPSLLVRQLYN